MERGEEPVSLNFDLSAMDGLDERFAESAKKLESMTDGDEFKASIKGAMAPITEEAKARVHSITGKLAAGIETYVKVSADAPTEIEVGISYTRHKGAHHAHLVEGGHGGPHPAPPHPFWEPADKAHGEDRVDALEYQSSEIEDAVIDEITR